MGSHFFSATQNDEENVKPHLELAVDTISHLRNANQEITRTQQTSGQGLIKTTDYRAVNNLG